MLPLLGCGPLRTGPLETLPAGPLPVTRGVALDESVADAADTLVLHHLAAWNRPGASAALFDASGVLYSAGYGWADLASERPFAPDTPVLWSSISKTLIGIAALQAVEQGRVTLDTPAGELLPFEVDNPRVDGETIALRHLLTHTSGIRDSLIYSLNYAPGDPVLSLEEYLSGYVTEGGEHYARANFANEAPGDSYAYSNDAAALAALALGEAAGLEFADLVARDILAPLGMAGSFYFYADQTEVPATPYKTTSGGFRPYPQYGYPTYPDGMMHSGAEDLARVGSMVLGGGSFAGVTLLSPESVEAMLAPQPLPVEFPEGFHQGVIWFTTKAGDHTFVGHSGGDFGSNTELVIDRDLGVGLCLLLHTSPPTTRDEYDAWLQLEQDLVELAAGLAR